eukprot:scaffold52186_cov29-Tisochrysis_lutea.AAC.6
MASRATFPRFALPDSDGDRSMRVNPSLASGRPRPGLQECESDIASSESGNAAVLIGRQPPPRTADTARGNHADQASAPDGVPSGAESKRFRCSVCGESFCEWFCEDVVDALAAPRMLQLVRLNSTFPQDPAPPIELAIRAAVTLSTLACARPSSASVGPAHPKRSSSAVRANSDREEWTAVSLAAASAVLRVGPALGEDGAERGGQSEVLRPSNSCSA